MFDAIADRYDLMNRVMTMGQDQRWRRFVVHQAQVAENGRVLDLATGTGDIAAMFAGKGGNLKIAAGDFSANMLRRARQRFDRVEPGAILWLGCDANLLPFVDESFDAVCFGYLLRNVDEPLTVLREVWRVLRPGGRVVCLDTTPPRRNLLYPFIQAYLRGVVPLMGRLIARDESAYAYLTGSTMGFYSAEALAALFRLANFVDVDFRKFMMGTVAVHWGTRR